MAYLQPEQLTLLIKIIYLYKSNILSLPKGFELAYKLKKHEIGSRKKQETILVLVLKSELSRMFFPQIHMP